MKARSKIDYQKKGPIDKVRRKKCWYWNKGFCKIGDDCRFYHSIKYDQV